MFATHATTVGAITSLALAAIDTALWDWRCRRDGQPLWLAAGGAKQRIPVYTTEGGWLHLSPDDLVRETLAAQAAGFKGAKLKVGKPHVSEDVARLKAVREAVGDGFEIMVDANQCFTLERSAAPRAALCRARHRLVRGAAAGRRHHRPCAAGGGQRGADRGRRIAVLASASSRPTCSRARRRSCRSTWRASAASRRG